MRELKATLNINVTKIDKGAIVQGKNGKYIDLALIANENDDADQYGNHGFITQSISKERRDAGERGPIVGNFKLPKVTKQQPVDDVSNVAEEDDSIPF
jgi:hypothetical protein